MTLPATGTISYGNSDTGIVEFDGIVKTTVSIKPVLDEAGRMLVYNAVTFEVTSRISLNTTDGIVSDMRYILTQPGLALHYDGKGFAEIFAVNDTAGFVDCVWGPTPELLTYMPIGNNQGANVVWRCTVHIKECGGDSGPNASNAILALNYEQEWSISEEGLTTRTTTGYLEIGSQEGRLTNSVLNYADTFREKCNLPLLQGFRRTQTYKMDKSKRRLDFTVTDAEVPYPLPAGITRASATHTLESTLTDGFMLWYGTIQASLTTGPAPVLKSDAAERFQIIVNSRIGGAKANIFARVGQLQAKNAGKTPTVMLTSYSVSEEIFERVTNFSVKYKILGVRLEDILGVSGLWTALPNVNFNTWTLSMSGNVWTPRGSAGLQTRTDDDLLLDLCSKPLPKFAAPGAAKFQAGVAAQNDLAGAGQTIDPSASWVYFRCKVVLDENDRVSVHKPLTGAAGSNAAAAPYTLLAGAGSSGGGNSANLVTGASTTGGPAPGVKATVPDLVQRVSAPSYRIRLVGAAMRLEYRVPVPAAVTIGGQPATQIDRHVEEEQIASVGGIPIFYTTWDVGYILPGTPSDLGAPNNPQFLTPGWTGSGPNLAG